MGTKRFKARKDVYRLFNGMVSCNPLESQKIWMSW
jgi:hypothetical protein